MNVQARLVTATRISEIVRVWAEYCPDLPALHDPEASWTYGELWQAIQEIRSLLVESGVTRGDRVVLVAENCNQQVALIMACVSLMAWPASLNARMSAREIDNVIEHCQPRAVFFSAGVSHEALKHAGRHNAKSCIASKILANWCLLYRTPSIAPEPYERSEDVAALVYTSGTTGAPKGVMVSHQGLLHFARISCASRDLSINDHVYGVLPLSHVFGFATILLSTLYSGASLTLDRRFTPERLLEVLEQGITTFQGVPTLYSRLLEYLQYRQLELKAPALRYLYSGGASLDMAVKRKVEALFGLPLHQGYGMTEYAGSMFITRTDAPRDDESSGHINEGVELRLVGPKGQILANTSVGEIWIKGPGVMRGYYLNSSATREVLSDDGWFNTGDLGHLDDTGALFIVGRNKDLIIRSGFNVYPVEVESVLNAWPAIQLAAVVGSTEADGNEQVVAFLELSPGSDLALAALNDYLKQHLAPYKKPTRLIILKQIPVTLNGKLQKILLKNALAEGLEQAELEVLFDSNELNT